MNQQTSNGEAGGGLGAASRSAIYGSKEHVAECASRWLKSRELTAQHIGDLAAMRIIVRSLDEVEREFWDSVRYALENNAVIPPNGRGERPGQKDA